MKIKQWAATIAAAVIFTIVGTPKALADSYSGEKTLGVRGGYNTYNESGIAGIEFTYRFNKMLRIAPSADYIFRHNGIDALKLNVNVQMPIPLNGGKWDVFPYAGLNYSSWNYHPGNGIDDVSSRISRFGLNLGAGIDVNLTPTLRLTLSGNYTVIKSFHGADILLGIAYRF